MKKRLASALLALCLLAALLMPFASAADDLFFVAVNDTVPLTLSADEKPYSAATGLYVPYTVFNCSPCGVAVGYNAATQSLILFSTQKRLIFDIEKGTCTDENDTVTEVLTTYKNGRLYIPLASCCAHFGLSYSILTSAGGYSVLRFTNGRQVYDDALFLEKAENLIAYRVESMQNPNTQSGGSVSNDEKNEDDTTPIYFLICDAAQMPAAMTELKKQNATAAFFLTAAEIRAYPDLVRKLYAHGYTIGITAETDAADAQQALRDANDALDAILHFKTLYALVTAEQKPQVSGYFTFTRPASEQSITEIIRFRADKTYVCLDNAQEDMQTAENLGAELSALRENMS